ncbi:MAG: ribosome maturation factor RimP [Clostridia bacterium]|nr:ribosome maturation factor RimP [Clostridia bacterium]
MPRHSMPVREAREIAQKIAREMQVELVDVELVKEPTGHFLRFYVDRPEGIALNDLEAFHRRILPLVERVEYDYMEVSSPGADRPLKTDADFEKAKGTEVELKTYKAVDGQKRFTGVLEGLDGDDIVLTDLAGEELRFTRKAVALIRPLIEFDEDDLADDAPAGQSPE